MGLLLKEMEVPRTSCAGSAWSSHRPGEGDSAPCSQERSLGEPSPSTDLKILVEDGRACWEISMALRLGFLVPWGQEEHNNPLFLAPHIWGTLPFVLLIDWGVALCGLKAGGWGAGGAVCLPAVSRQSVNQLSLEQSYKGCAVNWGLSRLSWNHKWWMERQALPWLNFQAFSEDGGDATWRLTVLLIPGRCGLNVKRNGTLFWAPKADVRVVGFRDEGPVGGDGGGGVWLVLAFSCMTECCKILVLGRCISWGQKHKYEVFCLLCLEFYGAVTTQEEPWHAWVFGGWASWDGSTSWGYDNSR